MSRVARAPTPANLTHELRFNGIVYNFVIERE
jgi:hypothetical protein